MRTPTLQGKGRGSEGQREGAVKTQGGACCYCCPETEGAELPALELGTQKTESDRGRAPGPTRPAQHPWERWLNCTFGAAGQRALKQLDKPPLQAGNLPLLVAVPHGVAPRQPGQPGQSTPPPHQQETTTFHRMRKCGRVSSYPGSPYALPRNVYSLLTSKTGEDSTEQKQLEGKVKGLGPFSVSSASLANLQEGLQN